MDWNLFLEYVEQCEDKREALEEAVMSCSDKETAFCGELRTHIEKMQRFLDEEHVESTWLRDSLFCCNNVKYSLDKLPFAISKERKRIYCLEIEESILRLRYFMNIQQDNSWLSRHWEKVYEDVHRAWEHRNEDKSYKYKVSIMVMGYNKLEYTKRAIDSIMKNTDFSKGEVELITLNNGSSDETEAYFESLPHEKKLNFKHNLFPLLMNERIVEGKYFLAFANDVIATPHWIDQLVECIESSADIAMVVPTCPVDSISRGQGIALPYPNDFSVKDETIHDFAIQYNHSNPEQWEERSLLMPFVSVVRSRLYFMNMVDVFYVKHFFIDDDFSTLLRRTGWRMILAKDTFLHHFGSVTLGKGQNNESQIALAEMRKVYFDKWGVDAWDSIGSVPGLNVALQWVPMPRGDSRILWLEPKFGMDYMMLRNIFRRAGEVHGDAIIFDEKYLPDAKYYFEHCVSARDISEAVPQMEGQYDVIGMGAYFHEVASDSAVACLQQLFGLLKPGGVMIVPVKNWGSASSLVEFIQHGGMPQQWKPAQISHVFSVQELLAEIKKHADIWNVHWQGIPLPQDEALSNVFQPRLVDLFSQVYTPETLKEQLRISMLWMAFSKPGS